MKKNLAIVFMVTLMSTAIANEDFSGWLSNTYQTDFGGSNYLAFLELAPRTKNGNGDFCPVYYPSVTK